MSETNRIHYIPETVFGTKPTHPIGEIKPTSAPLPSRDCPLGFNGVITGPPKGIAQFFRDWADQAEAMDGPEITIEVKGPAGLMPKVKA